MKIKKINLIYFSPTKGTEKIVKTIGQNLGNAEIKLYNLTKNEFKEDIFSKNEIAVFGVPVYSGRIPTTALERLKFFQGNKTPAVLIAVYGNRHYDDTLLEMKNFVSEHNFLPVAAGAFLAKHSFSTAEFPIINDRPNSDDLKTASNFAQNILNKILKDDFKEVIVPGNLPYKEKSKGNDATPSTIEEKCIKCGKCEIACPVNAIKIGKTVATNSDLCIKCMACVNVCPVEARLILDERLLSISKRLHKNLTEPRKIELFL